MTRTTRLWHLLHANVYSTVQLWHLLHANIYSTVHCIRLRLNLAEWQSEGRHLTPPSLQVRRGHLDELIQLREKVGSTTLAFYEDRTHGLRHFYLGMWDNQIAHILWIVGAGEACTVSDLKLQPSEVELRNGHTLIDFRRRHIFAHTLQAALHDLQSSGIQTAYAHVNEDNTASFNALIALGFRPTGRITIRRTLGVDWIRHEKTEKGSAAW